MKPQIDLTFGGILGLAAVAILGFLAWYIYTKRNAITTAINPLDQNNAAITVANKIVTATTGEDNTLGGWLYDITHPGTMRAIAGNPTIQ